MTARARFFVRLFEATPSGLQLAEAYEAVDERSCLVAARAGAKERAAAIACSVHQDETGVEVVREIGVYGVLRAASQRELLEEGGFQG